MALSLALVLAVTQPSPVVNRDNKKRKRKNENEEGAAFILDDLGCGERVLYLQEAPYFAPL